MSGATPRIQTRLAWEGGLRFAGDAGGTPVNIDGDAESAASPVQMLSAALAGCMAIDVVHILERMRTPPDALDIELTVERADRDPRRVVAARLCFHVCGKVPTENLRRALELSRSTYCSVWHSLRLDVDLDISFEIDDAGAAAEPTADQRPGH